MEKELYEKPSMKVYVAELQCQILAGSPQETIKGKRRDDDYGDPISTWE